MQQRLQKILADAGYGSRRSCERLIADGRVSVNGIPVTRQGSRADPLRDAVSVDGERIRIREKVYVLLNKPRGYICTSRDERGRKTVHELLGGAAGRLFTVGRLDRDAEGLLLLTNDGDFAQRVAHPRAKVGKTYVLEVRGKLSPAARARIQRGVWIDGRMTLPCEILNVRPIGAGERITIRIREGRKRQLKRMFSTVGCPVKRLQRVAIGGLKLGGLAEGKWRKISRTEADKAFSG